ncbi:MAG: hypothetical protein R8G66_22195 [Cytophagales bacterium]|nr:hypothetical protein [Cytophagales bacterium]
MYLLIAKNPQKILSTAEVEKQDEATTLDIFPQAESHHLLAWWEGEEIPEQFEIDAAGNLRELSDVQLIERGLLELSAYEVLQEGKIVAKQIDQLVEEGLLTLKPGERVVDNRVQSIPMEQKVAMGLISIRTPFEFVEADEIKERTLEEVLQKPEVVTTLEEAQQVEQEFYKSIEQAVAQAFSPGYELKLTKDYTLWMAEGSPDGDSRQSKFEHMQQEIATLKYGFSEQKAKVRALVAGFQ